jgi:NAD(P)-dependent dehydrogenase (short-subunit alcohol dehydrogenase family)
VDLSGQTVVVLGGSSGIGLATAHHARAAGADVILTGRDPARLEAAAREVGAVRAAAFDATGFARLEEFFAELPAPVDHVLVTAGSPYYAPLAEIDFELARAHLDGHLWLALRVAQLAVGRVRPGGTLLFVGGTGARRPASRSPRR